MEHTLEGTLHALLPTPVHFSMVIEPRGEGAVITDDAIHHPCQLVDPEWGTLVDADHAMTAATRRAMLEGALTDGDLLIGSHWAGSSCGHVRREGNGYRLTD